MAVENPMSLVVTENITIGAELQADLPSAETFLLNTNKIGNKTIVIPAGVKVVKAYARDSYWNGQEVYCRIYNASTNIYWCQAEGWDDISDTKYVGVSPNKTYILNCYTLSDGYATLQISYSADINTKVPDITDY